MKILLDTHILIWALNDDKKLSSRARELICDPDNQIFFSVLSVWEVAIKHELHPDNVTFGGALFADYCQKAGFIELTLTERQVRALETLVREPHSPPHRDPFDRMLLSQAKSENMLFLTADSLLPYYREGCIVQV